jgi:hypothetical protein
VLSLAHVSNGAIPVAITPPSITTSALTVNALTTPTTPTLTITGGASGHYTYFVYALDNTGTNYSASAGVATTVGPTTLGVGNTIQVNCPAAVTGQVGSYSVVRSAGGTNQGTIGTCAGSGSLTDNGISATVTTKTAGTNTTGPVSLPGYNPYNPASVAITGGAISGTSMVPQTILCHAGTDAGCTPTAALLSNTQISNYGQGAASITMTGPTLADGINFVFIAETAQAVNFWEYTSNSQNIRLDGAASLVTSIYFAAPAVGDSFACVASNNAVVLSCSTRAGTSSSTP